MWGWISSQLCVGLEAQLQPWKFDIWEKLARFKELRSERKIWWESPKSLKRWKKKKKVRSTGTYHLVWINCTVSVPNRYFARGDTPIIYQLPYQAYQYHTIIKLVWIEYQHCKPWRRVYLIISNNWYSRVLQLFVPS